MKHGMAGILAVPRTDLGPRLVQLAIGLVLFGLSASMMVLSRLGLDPWDVFHQGLARRTGTQIGTVTVIVGVVVLLLWIPLRQRPGIGTLANVVVIGLTMNVILGAFGPPHAIAVRWALLLGGILLCGIATGCYIGAGLGPGPRDGLMTGFAARGHSIRVVRTAIELSVLGVGFLLGGTVGIGTVIYALSIGPLAHVFLPLLSRDRAASHATRPSASAAATTPATSAASPDAGPSAVAARTQAATPAPATAVSPSRTS
jgi:uncharacterized membrane protein YczE